MIKKILPIVLLSSLLCFCQRNPAIIAELYALPKKLKEVSGIVFTTNSQLAWVLEDSGNANEIYGLNSEGKLKKTITIAKTQNIDWEDITKDSRENLYIGDFGNNDNIRKDLAIYKIDKDSLYNESVTPSYKISFAYPEQTQFPPKKTELFYDVEAFIEYQNNFYLFTKNRSKGFDGTTFLYKVPNKAGFHQAKLLGKFKAEGGYQNAAITSATISPDGKKVVLLSHSQIWIFDNFKSDNFFLGKVKRVQLNHYSQKEAICFKDNSTLLIADEKTKKIGGIVYELNLNSIN
ncbi:hypothetical protein FEM21_05570 [Flavobacterium seoulense]|uniref:T9SS C-terminal target domain-containing protein n=1 Tax=Flavobacterium seoulense TaxID=1492738 RepID=A0A066WUX2_9FLAO|nr:hypothetical protein [Flavobacterium seoulense]KDN56358.1 hypothetical protein FEM21_05570 [Flavobacterium seoulense]